MIFCIYTHICVPAHLIVDMRMYLIRLLSAYDRPRDYMAA